MNRNTVAQATQRFAAHCLLLTRSCLLQSLVHCLIILSMGFILGATLFMVIWLQGIGGGHILFLVLDNPVVDEYSQTRVCSLSETTDYLNQTSCLVAKVEEDQKLARMCSLQNIGGHFMKLLIIASQVLLCMHLQGTPARAREIPFQIVFSPLLLLQGVGAVFSTIQLLESIVIRLLNIEARSGRYFTFSTRVHEFLEFMLHGSRLLGWWSIDDGGREAEERVHYNHGSGCYTFSNNPPDVLKKMSKRDLVEEVWTLQVALNEQIKTTRSSKRKYELLRDEKVLCTICSEKEIDVVLFPCKHWILCRSCCMNCSACPACHSDIRSGLLVYA